MRPNYPQQDAEYGEWDKPQEEEEQLEQQQPLRICMPFEVDDDLSNKRSSGDQGYELKLHKLICLHLLT